MGIQWLSHLLIVASFPKNIQVDFFGSKIAKMTLMWVSFGHYDCCQNNIVESYQRTLFCTFKTGFPLQHMKNKKPSRHVFFPWFAGNQTRKRDSHDDGQNGKTTAFDPTRYTETKHNNQPDPLVTLHCSFKVDFLFFLLFLPPVLAQ